MIELTDGVFLNIDNVMVMEIIGEDHLVYSLPLRYSKIFAVVTHGTSYPLTRITGDVLISSVGGYLSPLCFTGEDAKLIRAYMDEYKGRGKILKGEKE